MADLYSLHRLTLAAPGEFLYAALSAAVPGFSKHMAREAIMAGLVEMDGRPAREPKLVMPERATVALDLRHGIKRALKARLHDEVVPTGKPFTILFDDEHLLIIDKAPGIVSAPSRSKGIGEAPERGHLPELVRRAFRKQGRELTYLGVVHRLDKDTSGCICFGLTREAQRMLSAQFAGQAAGRTYRALVMGQPRNDRDTLHNKLGHGDDGRRAVVEEGEDGKDSVTHFTVLRRLAQGAELEVTLETGRTHQIRITLADIGCPVYGDRIYGWKPRKNQIPHPRAPRLMLHAQELSLDHPATGKRITVRAPVPQEFTDFMQVIDQPAPSRQPGYRLDESEAAEPRPMRRKPGR